MSTTETIINWATLIFAGSMLVWLGTALYLAYFKMDMMLGHLKNCSIVRSRDYYFSLGTGGRLRLLGNIMEIMTLTHLHHGRVSAEDLKNFPAGLRRLLIILQRTGWVFLLLSVVAYLVDVLGLV
jgi:hypothetical protein